VELSSSQEKAKCQSSTRAHPSRTEGTHVRMPSEERPQPPKPQTARGGGAGSAAKGGVNVKEEVPLIDAAAVGDTERTISPWPGAADMTQHPKREETTQKITDTSSATPAEDSSMISPSTAVSSDEDHKLLRRRNVLVRLCLHRLAGRVYHGALSLLWCCMVHTEPRTHANRRYLQRYSLRTHTRSHAGETSGSFCFSSTPSSSACESGVRASPSNKKERRRFGFDRGRRVRRLEQDRMGH
jgi:hypothetical protein